MSVTQQAHEDAEADAADAATQQERARCRYWAAQGQQMHGVVVLPMRAYDALVSGEAMPVGDGAKGEAGE